MSPLRAADDVEPSLILRPCSFDTFMAGPVGKITSNQVRTDDDHRATITQNSKNWKCSDVSPAETPIPSAATSEPPPQGRPSRASATGGAVEGHSVLRRRREPHPDRLGAVDPPPAGEGDVPPPRGRIRSGHAQPENLRHH